MTGVREEIFWISAVVLSLERIAYVAIWRKPAGFRRLCEAWWPGTPPVDVIARLFVAFKATHAGRKSRCPTRTVSPAWTAGSGRNRSDTTTIIFEPC